MKVFERKSIESSKAAKGLIETHKLYNPSIHCSYYSCVQYMLHVLYAYLRYYDLKTEEERNKMIKKLIDESAEIGWHNRLIQTILKRFPAKTSSVAQFRFKSWISDLKSLRQESDYFETVFDETRSKEILARSAEVNSLLKESFEL